MTTYIPVIKNPSHLKSNYQCKHTILTQQVELALLQAVRDVHHFQEVRIKTKVERRRVHRIYMKANRAVTWRQRNSAPSSALRFVVLKLKNASKFSFCAFELKLPRHNNITYLFGMYQLSIRSQYATKNYWLLKVAS
jgi:hypothetical protein